MMDQSRQASTKHHQMLSEVVNAPGFRDQITSLSPQDAVSAAGAAVAYSAPLHSDGATQNQVSSASKGLPISGHLATLALQLLPPS